MLSVSPVTGRSPVGWGGSHSPPPHRYIPLRDQALKTFSLGGVDLLPVDAAARVSGLAWAIPEHDRGVKSHVAARGARCCGLCPVSIDQHRIDELDARVVDLTV